MIKKKLQKTKASREAEGDDDEAGGMRAPRLR